jgi:hypothetical protein
MNCPACGSPGAPSQRFCDECGAALGNVPPPAEVATGPVTAPQPQEEAGPVPTRTLPGTPILLSDGEILWRQYQVVQLHTRQQGEGSLYVTDSRVIFYARAKGRGTQRPSMLVQQTKLENITGLAVYVTRRVSLWLFLGIIFGIGWTLVWFAIHLVLVGVLSLAVVIACFFAVLLGKAKHGAVRVRIDSEGGDSSPISFGRYGRRGPIAVMLNSLIAPLRAIFGVFTAIDVPVGSPGEDAEKLVAELGALIMDLQTRGSLAGEHWGVGAGQSRAPGAARSA